MAAGLCVLLSLAIKNGDKVCKVLRGKNVMLQATIVGDVQQQVVEIFNICAVARLHGKQEDNAHLFGAGIPVKGLVEQRHRHFGLGAAGAERVGDGEHRVHGGVGERLALKDGGQEGFIGDALVLQHVAESFQHLALSSGLGEAAEKLRVKKSAHKRCRLLFYAVEHARDGFGVLRAQAKIHEHARKRAVFDGDGGHHKCRILKIGAVQFAELSIRDAVGDAYAVPKVGEQAALQHAGDGVARSADKDYFVQGPVLGRAALDGRSYMQRDVASLVLRKRIGLRVEYFTGARQGDLKRQREAGADGVEQRVLLDDLKVLA